MRRFCLFLFLLILLNVAMALAQSYSYKTLDNPAGTFTTLVGINENGVIVGGYTNQAVDPPDTLHGFVYAAGRHVTLDFPNASFTLPQDINNHGVIAGTYIDGTGQHGFVWTERGFKTVDYPGAQTSVLTSINDHGLLAGFFIDAIGIHGFLGHPGSFVALDHPGTDAGTVPNGLNARRQLTGQWNMNGGIGAGSEAFVYDHDSHVWTDFTRPNSEYTLGEDINDRGQVVGFFSLPQFHGFLKTGNHYDIIDYPGVVSTIALGLNNQGVIVGNYFDDNGTQHGFVATPKRRKTSTE